ncbi:uncharacterized protein VTP21DRAFT_10400 [Calcarisporiella thermophila]|uniref:uncharacterized protein n=1 Tax=Calcarisporiella thermophila TaxID=911321 RepID=UPI0037428842
MPCVYGFGFNAFGQITGGNESTVISPPKEMTGFEKVLFASWEMVAGVIRDQENESKLFMLGFDYKRNCRLNEPRPLMEFKHIIAPLRCYGGSHVEGVLDASGCVWELANKEMEAVLVMEKCRDVASTRENVTGIDDNGELWTWKLGNRTPIRKKLTPLGDIPRFTRIEAGDEHFLALAETGDVYVWGSNRFGQLGIAPAGQEPYERPTPLEALQGIPVDDFSCGSFHSAVIAQGELYTFGWGQKGQLGHEETGVQVVLLGDENGEEEEKEYEVKQITCGSEHTVALTRDGTVWVAGWNKYGQLGLAPESGGDTASVTGNEHLTYSEAGENESSYERKFKPLSIEPFVSRRVTRCFASNWNTYIEMG